MPYLTKEAKERLAEGGLATTAGELNCQITREIINYWYDNLPQNYQRINDIIGALEGAKAEFYRRVVVPYEDKKIKENGDVY